MIGFGEGSFSNKMRKSEVLLYNEFVDVVPTCLLCSKLVDMELMFPAKYMKYMNLY